MDEKPVEALRKKRDNSISRCWGLMAAGEVKAVVSAGNTGAMVASALFNAKMFLPGVRRPGIAAIFPSHQGPIVIIDVGANMNAKAEDLYQYGVMGAIYAEEILGVTSPRIGLLNVGTEDEKGNELTKATRACTRQSPLGVRFVGNVEGRDIYEGQRPGRHLRRVRRQRPAQGRRGGRRVPLLGRSSRSWPGSCPTCRATPGQRSPRAEGLKTRFEYEEFGGGPAARHPRRLHHLPRRLGRPGDQERPPRRRHDGRRAAQRPDRRAARRRADRRIEAPSPSETRARQVAPTA